MGIIFNIGESLKLSAFNILQEPIKMLMENETEAFEKKSLISKVYVMKTTDKFQEEYRSRTAMEGFKPTEDMEVPDISDFGEGYRKVFRTQIWTNSFVISKQTMEDNQSMNINTSAVGFIKSYGRTREQFAFKLLAGAVASPATGFVDIQGKKFDVRGADTVEGSVDGTGTPQNYFHNAHKLVGAPSGKDQANKFQASVDIGSAGGIEKLIDVIEEVAGEMEGYTDEKGNLLALGPDTIIIPAGQHRLRDAITIGLKSKYGSTMGGNGVNPYYGKFEVIEAPYLNNEPGFTAADQGILLVDSSANKEYLGAVWFDRTQLEVSSYIDPYTKANVWDGRARFGAGFNNYRAMAYVCTGSGASDDAKRNAESISPAPVGGGAIATKSV